MSKPAMANPEALGEAAVAAAAGGRGAAMGAAGGAHGAAAAAAGGARGAAAAAAGGARGAAARAAGGGRGAAGGHRRAGMAAAGGDLLAEGAHAGGGQRRGAPRLHGAPPGLGDGNKQLWLAGNSNKYIEEEKVTITGSPFKSDYTPVKLKNKRLEQIHEELRALKNLCSKTSNEMQPEAFARQKDLFDEAKKIEEELKDVKEMAIPMPKVLLKKPMSRIHLSK